MRSINIDFEKDILEIDGEVVKDRAVVVFLPSSEISFPYSKLFNPELVKEDEEIDRIEVKNVKEGNHDDEQ